MNNNYKKGFAVFFITILVLIASFGIIMNTAIIAYLQALILRDATKSTQAYYAAEAGIEDVLLQLRKNGSSPAFSYNINDVGLGAATIVVPDIIGGSRTIISTGAVGSVMRKIQVVWAINSKKISFHYGAQIGEGGMVMGNNSKVAGNVFSNGDIAGGGTIVNDVIISGNEHKLQGVSVGNNASVYTCQNANITGTLFYVSGGSFATCDYGSAVDLGPEEIADIPLPISQDQINEWQIEAAAGGINSNNITVAGIQYLGPIQIGTPAAPKNLIVNGTLKVTGTIYVTGNITVNNSAELSLDASYGSLSGVIIADGVILVENNAVLSGSGQAGSYILVLSTKSDIASPVINVRNNAGGAIFYTNSGLIYLKNNMKAREITGYKVQLENKAEIQYESGLENANFSSGPGGGWEVQSWSEIE